MTAIPFTCLSSSGTSSPSWTQTQRKAGHFLWLLLSISQYWHGWVSLMTVKEKPLMLKFHDMHRWCIYMQLNIHCYCWKPKIGVPSKFSQVVKKVKQIWREQIYQRINSYFNLKLLVTFTSLKFRHSSQE